MIKLHKFRKTLFFSFFIYIHNKYIALLLLKTKAKLFFGENRQEEMEVANSVVKSF